MKIIERVPLEPGECVKNPWEESHETSPPISGVLVETEVKDTNTSKGKGLYAKQFIAQGTRVWRPYLEGVTYKATNVRVFGKTESIAFLENPLIENSKKVDLLEKTYGDAALRGMLGKPEEGVMFLPLDDSQYINHAPLHAGANIGSWYHIFDSKLGIDEHSSFALQDILPGEEILEDYNDFEHPAWFCEILHKYGKVPTFYKIKPHHALSSTQPITVQGASRNDEKPSSTEELIHTEAAMVLASLRETKENPHV